LNKQDITDIIDYQSRLKDLDKKLDFYNNYIKGLMIKKLQLEKEIKDEKINDINLK
jgi:hypothetical protein